MAAFSQRATDDSHSPDGSGYRAAPLRLAIALGDPERERTHLPYLSQREEITVAVRCLAAEELLVASREGQVDVAVVASDLHRLAPAILADLRRMPLRLVVLAHDADAPRWEDAADAVLPVDVEPEALVAAILAAARGERAQARSHTISKAERDSSEDCVAAPAGISSLVLAVTSGPGSPGRTTVAINLAAGLGAVAPTILVDGDLTGPSVAACLDVDPTRNLAMLAHTDPGSPPAWERAMADETAPIGPRSPHGRVLCGVPKPEMQGLLSRGFLARLVDELTRQYRYVILDVGAEGLRGETALHRLALSTAHHILFLTSADLVGLFRARTALARLQLDSRRDQFALVMNRYDARSHHRRSEIEWALGIPVAAIIPYDHNAAEHALASQRPLVLEGRGRAARALLDLAERVHGGSIRLPPEPVGRPARRWWRLGFGSARQLRARPLAPSQSGALDG